MSTDKSMQNICDNKYIIVNPHSLHKHKVDGSHKTAESHDMVPVQTLSLKQDIGDDGEDNERHHLLHHLQLHK